MSTRSEGDQSWNIEKIVMLVADVAIGGRGFRARRAIGDIGFIYLHEVEKRSVADVFA